MTIYSKITSSNINQNDGMIKILKILKSLPIFLTMKMTFSLNKCSQGVRLYKGEFVTKIMTSQSKTISQCCHQILAETLDFFIHFSNHEYDIQS